MPPHHGALFWNVLIHRHVNGTSAYSAERPDSDVSQLRDKMDFLTVELFNAELQLDVLWQAMAFAKNNFQRIGEDRDRIFAVMNQRPIPPQLPTEIIMQIAGYLRWTARIVGETRIRLCVEWRAPSQASMV